MRILFKYTLPSPTLPLVNFSLILALLTRKVYVSWVSKRSGSENSIVSRAITRNYPWID